MTKKVYSIHGFDCAVCASHAEEHLNKHKDIEKCVLDFAGDKLYITYKNRALSISQIKKIIKEVEDDDIEVLEEENKKEYKILNKDNLILLGRIIFSLLIVAICYIWFNEESYFWYLFSFYLVGLVVLSYDIYLKVFKRIIHKKNPLDEFLLITLASIGAFIVGAITKEINEFMESILVVMLFQIGQVIESVATNKSKKAINSALNLRSDYANLFSDDKIVKVKPEELKVGDIVIISSGENVPVDGEIIEGSAFLDTASINGEFIPTRVNEGEDVLSGTIVKEGTIKLKVSKTYENSTVSKLIELISHSGERKSKADKFVTKFAKVYTPVVFLISLVVLIVGGSVTSLWFDYSLLGLKMLVVACPCAVVISVPMAYFSGIGLASKNGIVIKGTNYLDELNRLKKIYTDKTGTLTKGNFVVKEIFSVDQDNEKLCQIISSLEELSNHPIGKAAFQLLKKEKTLKVSSFKEIAGLGIEGKIEKKLYRVGNEKFLKNSGVLHQFEEKSGTILYVSCEDKFIGYVLLGDEIKEESSSLVADLNKLNIDVEILSGDKNSNVKHIAEEIGVRSFKGELMPNEKLHIMESSKNEKFAVGYIGDGINDAATLKSSDIGFAMGGIGSDIAVENADVVIMNDNPHKVYDSIVIARKTRAVALFNIIFAVSIKMGIEFAAIISSILGRGEVIPMWLAVLADTGLTVLLIINSLLLLYRNIDKKSVK